MKWFGKSWGAPVCDAARHVDLLKVEGDAIRCSNQKEIVDTDQGVLLPFGGSVADLAGMDVYYDNRVPHLAYHIDCFMEQLGF